MEYQQYLATKHQLEEVFANINQDLDVIEFDKSDSGDVTSGDVSPVVKMAREQWAAENKNWTKEMVTQRILQHMEGLSVFVEPFWKKVATASDNFSYRLITRRFPTFAPPNPMMPREQNENTKITEGDAKPAGAQAGAVIKEEIMDIHKALAEAKEKKKKIPRAEFKKLVQLTYDIRETTENFDIEYIDEGLVSKPGRESTKFALPPSRYYEYMRADTFQEMVQRLYKLHLYSAILKLVCICASSRYLCHFVMSYEVISLLFNNKNYVQTMGGSAEDFSPFQDPDYKEILYHCLFRMIYILNKEECTIKGFTNFQHRHVVNLRTACMLPVYTGPLESNPYIPLSLGADFLNAKGMNPNDYMLKPIQAPLTERGFYSLWSFKKRFEIFTGGIFTGMNYDKIYFGGSLIPACALRMPTERLFGIPHIEDMAFDEEIFPDDSLYDSFRNKVNRLNDKWGLYEENLQNYFDEYYPSKRIYRQEYLDTLDDMQLRELEEKMTDLDIMLDVVKDDEFDKLALYILQVIRENLSAKLGRPATNTDARLMRIETDKSYKYYLVGRALSRNIELFRMYVGHPLGGVARFHFPAVRGLYTGREVYVHPSLISFAYSGHFIDYKWMSSANNAKDLILKYYLRGGTVILNHTEHEELQKFISETPHWKKLLNWRTSGRYVSVNSPIFKPRKYGIGFHAGMPYDAKNMIPLPEYEYVPEEETSNETPKSRFGFNLDLRFHSGHIVPFNFWKLNAYVDALASSNKYADY